MPPPTRRRRTDTTHVESQRGTGFDVIQGYMFRHDENMIANHRDDIDTLLVFAGLFSAVLTAFLVGSTNLVQQDNAQVSVQLLSLIALRLDANLSDNAFVNSTASALPTSPDFDAATLPIIINSLWLISLILSLAAALLGLTAKQWCLEYLKWYSGLLPARSNVLLRQMRFEAWNRWHVPTFIGAIPALLETSLVLFLVGLVFFVQTLQRRLFIIVAAVAGSVLLGLFVLTILPVFYRLCPYKSPTSWAFVRLRTYTRHLTRSRGTDEGEVDPPGLEPENPESWTVRDMRHAIDPELCVISFVTDEQNATYNAYFAWEPRPEMKSLDAFQTSTLVRALAWVGRETNDPRLVTGISDSLPMLHDPQCASDVGWGMPYVHSLLYSLCKVIGWPTNYGSVRRLILMTCTQSFRRTDDNTEGRSYHFSVTPVQRLRAVSTAVEPLLRKASRRERMALRVLRQALYADLLTFVDRWLSQTGGTERYLVGERIVIILCTLRCVLPAEFPGDLALEDLDQWKEALANAFCRLAPRKKAYAAGLIPMILESLGMMGTAKIDFASNSVNVEYETSRSDLDAPSIAHWARLSVHIYHSSDRYSIEERRHLFIVSTVTVLDMLQKALESQERDVLWPEDAAALESLLECMVAASQISLVDKIPNYGAYIELPWPTMFARMLKTAGARVPLVDHPDLWQPFKHLLFLLRTSLEEGLLSNQARQDLAKISAHVSTFASSPGMFDAPFTMSEVGPAIWPPSHTDRPVEDPVVPPRPIQSAVGGSGAVQMPVPLTHGVGHIEASAGAALRSARRPSDEVAPSIAQNVVLSPVDIDATGFESTTILDQRETHANAQPAVLPRTPPATGRDDSMDQMSILRTPPERAHLVNSLLPTTEPAQPELPTPASCADDAPASLEESRALAHRYRGLMLDMPDVGNVSSTASSPSTSYSSLPSSGSTSAPLLEVSRVVKAPSSVHQTSARVRRSQDDAKQELSDTPD